MGDKVTLAYRERGHGDGGVPAPENGGSPPLLASLPPWNRTPSLPPHLLLNHLKSTIHDKLKTNVLVTLGFLTGFRGGSR